MATNSCTYAAQSNASKGINPAQIKPPLSSFSRLPAYSRASLSPSGTQLAFVQNFAAPYNLAVLTLYNPKTQELKRLLKSDNKAVKINWFKWASDDILIVSARYEAANRKVKYFQTRLMSIDVTQPEANIELTSLLKKRSSINYSTDNYISQFQDSVIDFLPNDPEHILVEVDFDTQSEPSVYKLNVRTDKQVRVERGKRDIRSWMTDQQHNLRVGIARDYRTGEITIYERKDDDTEFRVLFQYMSLTDEPISVRGFGLDPNVLYYTKYKDDKQALFTLNLTTMESTLVLSNPDYDIDGSLIYSPSTQDVIGVYDNNSPFNRYYFDDASYALHKRLDNTFPNTKNYVISRSRDESYYILLTESDDSPGMFYYGDQNANKIIPIAESYPELYGTQLAHHQKLSYKARDGTEIEAYLTLPEFGVAPYPTVIHPHGGPGARDYAGFDPWVAYMTSRGYAVMRPNFRGSSGYGFEFAQAQMGRWGLEMQDDITDAAQFLIDNGTSDAQKMCIFGASYGGYAAAMATVKTPDLFKCAVSFAGVSDLKELARNTRRFVGGKLVAKTQIGDDSADLESRSPLYNVSKITTPILLMHGDEDRSVLVAQSRDFAKALQDAGKNVRYVEFEAGDHYLSIQQNRTRFFEELDNFLGKYLGNLSPEEAPKN